jgi:predicted CxxxxCH...CXXCH cytochrome family protein
VPETVAAPGHNDGKVDVVFGGLATANGASPTWDKTNPASPSCSTTYCHGGTLAGGTNTAPVWTVVVQDPANPSSQVACGTCHGIPPPSAPHAGVGADPVGCNACHPGTVTADGSLNLPGGLHINGVRDVGAAGCTACHGDKARLPAANASAPPRDSAGNTAVTSRGVGAHQTHVTGQTAGGVVISQPIACGECHVVAQSLVAHPDGQIDMSWGLLAKAGGTGPSWNPATLTCSSTYCHGSTLQGGTNTNPVWTTVNGTQAACGTCHGIPPPPPHSQSLSCGTTACHSGYTSSTVNLITHLDGYVNLGADTCTSCHGTPSRPASTAAAPPPDVSGETLATATGVGAHLFHIQDNALRPAVACTECHAAVTTTDHSKPANCAHPPEPGSGGTCAVDMTFGLLATSGATYPVWDKATSPASPSCSATYCHGATLSGGTNTAPVWTMADGTPPGPGTLGSPGSQAACGTCHGIPPPPPHVTRMDCGTCHTGSTSTEVNLATHMNGVLDAITLRCTTCHGDGNRTPATAQAAPPLDTHGSTAPGNREVGAHQKHLVDGTFRKATACGECHVVPTVANHADAKVDVVFGPLATADGAAPVWNGTGASPPLTCSATYCHGETLTGGTRTAPLWTRVDGSQAFCGSCHGIPPPPPHVAATNCGGCHVGYTSKTVNLTQHIDGTLQAAGSCTSCHGDAARAPAAAQPAPPKDSTGNTATTVRSVGAHQAHLADGSLHKAIACAECHDVPRDLANHPDGAMSLAWGSVATGGGSTAPVFNGSGASPPLTCSATFCHGATLLGGTNKTPVWTVVDGTPATPGSQAACGTCHGIPPPDGTTHLGMTAATNCGGCHATAAGGDPLYTGTTVNPALHVNGTVEATGASCASCHGDPTRAVVAAQSAPPLDTQTPPNTATTARGVGAHQTHMVGNALARPVACSECHLVPATVAAPGHNNGITEVVFGTRAKTGGTAPTWNGAGASPPLTCSATYCHGATLDGGTNKAPKWTTVGTGTPVGGTQASCGTCHGVPPPAPHVQSTACGSCHTGYTATTVNLANHIDGTLNTSPLACTSCHGSPTRTLVTGADAQARAAPPVDSKGLSATTLRSVGVHQAHLNKSTGALASPTKCSECHAVPTSMAHADGVALVTFGTRAKTGGAAPTWDGVGCSATYCHGNFPYGQTAAKPSWTTAGTLACSACHAQMPPVDRCHPPQYDHDGGNSCNNCHKNTNSTGTAITSIGTHVNGVVNGKCTDCHNDENCTP